LVGKVEEALLSHCLEPPLGAGCRALSLGHLRRNRVVYELGDLQAYAPAQKGGAS
jgi:hypothetical protein